MFFQCPWLPEFMLTAQDVALFDGCFRSGPLAPRNKGAVSDEDIERFPLSSQTICVMLFCHTMTIFRLGALCFGVMQAE